MSRREREADVLVAGAGLGAVAAALAAADRGATVVLAGPSRRIGGQLTSQAVPPDEHPWIERFGCTARYRALRDGIRAYYRAHYPLTAAARARGHLNPGAARVSALAHEPRVAEAVLEAMLAAHRSSGRLEVLLEHDLSAADVDGHRIRAVTAGDRVVHAAMVIDATENGDLLPLTGAEHVTGFESREETGEPHAPAVAQPDNLQPVTACFAIDHLEGEDHTIPRPAGLLDLQPRGARPAHQPPGPPHAAPEPARRPGRGRPGSRRSGARPRPVAVPPHRRSRQLHPRRVRERHHARQLAAERLPGRQRDRGRRRAPRGGRPAAQPQPPALAPDGGRACPGLRLRGDVVGDTPDGLAEELYIRESRRIRGELTVVEQDIAHAVRGDRGAVAYPDSVGIGAYRIDLHPSTGGDPYIDIACCPFRIPLGALIPVRLDNLLAGAKNIATTHITNGAYRLHPVEWNIGEAAGHVAAVCAGRGTVPRAVRADPQALDELQRELVRAGVELAWPDVHAY